MKGNEGAPGWGGGGGDKRDGSPGARNQSLVPFGTEQTVMWINGGNVVLWRPKRTF